MFIFRDDEKVKSVQTLYRNCVFPSCKFQLKFTKVKDIQVQSHQGVETA